MGNNRELPPSRAFLVSCFCGAQVGVDPRAERRVVDCPECGASVDFVVSMDPRLKSPKVSIVLPRAAFAAQQAKAPAPPPPEIKAPKTVVNAPLPGAGLAAPCPCGATMIVDGESLTSEKTCTLCGTTYHVVLKRVPGTSRQEVILVPKKIVPVRRQTVLPPGAGSTRAGQSRVAKKPAGRTKVGNTRIGGKTVAKKGKAGAPGVQPVLCECGEMLYVHRQDLGRDIPCPRCGVLLHLHETLDPQTLVPRLEATPVKGRRRP